MASISGGAVIARMLRAEGVEVVFGIIDGSYFGLYASLRDVGIRLVTPRHETSAVHMAGALGTAVWALLPAFAEWRWLLDREDSIWYPSVRLFRQTRLDHWEDVFERVAQALREHVGKSVTGRPTQTRSR